MNPAALSTHDLIFTSDSTAVGEDPRSLTRDVERGLLVKLRRGVYVPATAWKVLDTRARHLTMMKVAAYGALHPLTFAGYSAAAVWGIPIWGDFPRDVTVLDRWKGGGRSESGVRRTAAGFGSAVVEERDGFAVTSLARTANQLCLTLPLRHAVATYDWSRWGKNEQAISMESLVIDLEHLAPRRGRRQAERALGRSATLSESFGESVARVVMWELGFPDPVLQREFTDSQGSMFPDYAWLEYGVLAEFDGKQKYMREEYTRGDPGEALWREKLREDRLRALGFTIVRIVWADIEHPERLAQKLLAAGVPRLRLR